VVPKCNLGMISPFRPTLLLSVLDFSAASYCRPPLDNISSCLSPFISVSTLSVHQVVAWRSPCLPSILVRSDQTQSLFGSHRTFEPTSLNPAIRTRQSSICIQDTKMPGDEIITIVNNSGKIISTVSFFHLCSNFWKHADESIIGKTTRQHLQRGSSKLQGEKTSDQGREGMARQYPAGEDI